MRRLFLFAAAVFLCLGLWGLWLGPGEHYRRIDGRQFNCRISLSPEYGRFSGLTIEGGLRYRGGQTHGGRFQSNRFSISIRFGRSFIGGYLQFSTFGAAGVCISIYFLVPVLRRWRARSRRGFPVERQETTPPALEAGGKEGKPATSGDPGLASGTE